MMTALEIQLQVGSRKEAMMAKKKKAPKYPKD